MADKKSLLTEFKEFVSRGNVMDLAVGVIIGGAFSSIVTSLCDDVITPLIQLIIGKATGKTSIEDMTAALNVGPINFGSFISAIINFFIMAIIIFALVKAVNKLTSIGKKPAEEVVEVTTKDCPFCFSVISIKATRCPHCTALLEVEDDKKVTVEKKKK